MSKIGAHILTRSEINDLVVLPQEFSGNTVFEMVRKSLIMMIEEKNTGPMDETECEKLRLFIRKQYDSLKNRIPDITPYHNQDELFQQIINN